MKNNFSKPIKLRAARFESVGREMMAQNDIKWGKSGGDWGRCDLVCSRKFEEVSVRVLWENVRKFGWFRFQGIKSRLLYLFWYLP